MVDYVSNQNKYSDRRKGKKSSSSKSLLVEEISVSESDFLYKCTPRSLISLLEAGKLQYSA